MYIYGATYIQYRCKIHPTPVQYIPNPGAKYTQYTLPPVQYIPNLMQDGLNMETCAIKFGINI